MKKNFLLIPALLITGIFFSCTGLVESVPGSPGSFTVDARSSGSLPPSLYLDWKGSTSNARGYTIERSESADFSSPATFQADSDAAGYLDSSIEAGKVYYYRIQSFNDIGVSEWTPSVSGIYREPAAPSDFTAVAASSQSILLTWTDNSRNETAFILQYSSNPDLSGASRVKVDADETSHTLSSLTPGTVLYMKLCAVNGVGESSCTGIIRFELQDIPTTLAITFNDGMEHGGAQKIYTVWLEGEDGFFQNVYVCSRIALQNLTGTALPYWELNKRSLSTETEIDTVTGGTVKDGDFTLDVPLKNLPERFTVYFEIDHSFDENGWFSDQPALLYSIPVDRTGSQKLFKSRCIGWTPNELTKTGGSGNIHGLTFPMGVLQRELGYIEKQYANGAFGNDEEKPATDLVGGLSAALQ